MKILLVIIAIISLLYLIVRRRNNAFLVLFFISVLLGVLLGIPLDKIIKSIEQGFGGILSSLSLILGFGTMIAYMMEISGAANVISEKILKIFKMKNLAWGVMVIACLISFALFFDASFVLFIPIVLTLLKQTKLPKMSLAITAAISLLSVHVLFPPHPGVNVTITTLGADAGRTIVYGLLIMIVPLIISAIILPKYYVKKDNVIESIDKEIIFDKKDNRPSFASSMFIIVLPIVLIMIGSFAPLIFNMSGNVKSILSLICSPIMALFITLVLSIYVLGIKLNLKKDDIMSGLSESLKPIAIVLLINGAGGGFKQILIDAKVTDDIVALVSNSNLSPIVFGFIVASFMRVVLGSSTVSAITTSGVLLPIVTARGR